jgi:hypothetical protein
MSCLRRSLPFAALLALAAPSLRAADGGTEIEQFLANTGAAPAAICRMRWEQDAEQTRLQVHAEHLAAGEYVVSIDGVAVHDGTLVVGDNGSGDLTWVTPQDGDTPLFDFEVLDKTVDVSQGETSFFNDVFASSGSSGGGGGGGGESGDGTEAEVLMVNVGPDLDAQGRLKFESKPGEKRFELQVEHLDAGSYLLRVAGAPVAAFDVTGDEQSVEFQDPVEPGKILLNFDPLGQQVDVVSADVVFLTVVMPASVTDSGVQPPKKGGDSCKDVGKKKGDALQVKLMNTGVDAGAEGKAVLSQGATSTFGVAIENVPDGDYTLEVGGVAVGIATASGGEAHFAFSTVPGDGEVLLDFPVQGQLISVTDGSSAILSVVFPVSVQAALGNFAKELHAIDHVKVNLVSTGVDLDARGRVDFRHKTSHDTLVVVVQDLPAGSYDIVLGAETFPGALVVASSSSKAKAVFDSMPKPGQLLLDVNPSGMTLQVTAAGDPGTVFFQAAVQ